MPVIAFARGPESAVENEVNWIAARDLPYSLRGRRGIQLILHAKATGPDESTDERFAWREVAWCRGEWLPLVSLVGEKVE